jgi:hypothetical protein
MHKKYKNVIAYRQRNFDKGCCIYCGDIIPENDMRTGCKRCRDKNRLREAVRRQEMKDFK